MGERAGDTEKRERQMEVNRGKRIERTQRRKVKKPRGYIEEKTEMNPYTVKERGRSTDYGSARKSLPVCVFRVSYSSMVTHSICFVLTWSTRM